VDFFWVVRKSCYMEEASWARKRKEVGGGGGLELQLRLQRYRLQDLKFGGGEWRTGPHSLFISFLGYLSVRHDDGACVVSRRGGNKRVDS
jgi:hypothetical protein